MAMAMASPAATAAASVATATSAKSLVISATKNFSTLSRSSVGVSHLHTSFYGMSLQARSSRMSFAELSGAHSNRNLPSVAPSKLVFTVAKIKTHKASAKRFRVTGSGKIMRRQAFKQHLLSKKPTHRKRRLSKSLRVSRSDYDNVTRALPYLKVKGKLA